MSIATAVILFAFSADARSASALQVAPAAAQNDLLDKLTAIPGLTVVSDSQPIGYL